MSTHRNGKVWIKGFGWQAKPEFSAAEYDEIGDGWIIFIAFCRFFPDFLADLMHDDTSADFELAFIQRLFMRIEARYQYVDIDACRGATKSFCKQLEEKCEGVVFPGQISAIVAPSFKQGAKIASQIHKQIGNNYPLLNDLYTTEADGTDRFVISTQYGSKISIEAFRGNTIFKATAEALGLTESDRFDPAASVSA